MKIPKIESPKQDRQRMLQFYRAGVAENKPTGKKGTGCIDRLQGNLTQATLLLVAPIPTKLELDKNFPWCNQAAHILFELLSNSTGIEHFENTILIAPACFHGTKIKKGNHEAVSELVEKAPKQGFTHFVAVGSAAFQTHFGHGKKPDMDVVAGTPLYPPLLKGCPLFVFPDITILAVDPESLSGFQKHKTRRIQAELCAQLEQLMPMFKTFLSLTPAGRR